MRIRQEQRSGPFPAVPYPPSGADRILTGIRIACCFSYHRLIPNGTTFTDRIALGRTVAKPETGHARFGMGVTFRQRVIRITETLTPQLQRSVRFPRKPCSKRRPTANRPGHAAKFTYVAVHRRAGPSVRLERCCPSDFNVESNLIVSATTVILSLVPRARALSAQRNSLLSQQAGYL